MSPTKQFQQLQCFFHNLNSIRYSVLSALKSYAGGVLKKMYLKSTMHNHYKIG